MWPEPSSALHEYALNIGELKVSGKPAIITCFGLGSCIGLFLFDRIKKVGGGAHIMLPGPDLKRKRTDGCAYAENAIAALLSAMSIEGCHVQGLRGKIIGGANVLANTNGFGSIGAMNIREVKSHLVRRGIYVAAEDVGGHLSRTARFNTQTGDVHISRTGEYYII